jgi:transaldolase
MTKLHDLYREGGQSPWIDNLMRGWLADGHLAWLLDEGVRGVTSNPTTVAKAIEATAAYDGQFRSGLDGTTIDQRYWELVLEDIRGALSVLSPLYEHSGGLDGFVSVEVAPSLAHDTDATVASALSLHERIARPNLLVKIPATREGVPAIRRVIGEGKSVNVTLIFSLERYGAVIEAYLSGLEDLVAKGGDPTRVASVASFFLSRVDTEVDQRLEAIAAEDTSAEPLGLRGCAAVAQAKLAYELFRDHFQGPRWDALSARGAWVQRPLWASTSAKNPDYPDLLYVNTLVGPDTVNTMPDTTLKAFLDHGEVARTVRQGLEEARSTLQSLTEVGVDLEAVAEVLEEEGVASFAKSFDECQEVLAAKAIEAQSG